MYRDLDVYILEIGCELIKSYYITIWDVYQGSLGVSTHPMSCRAEARVQPSQL